MATKTNRTTAQIRKIWGNTPAQPDQLTLFRWSTGARPLVQIRKGTERWFRAMDAVFVAWNYPVRAAGGFRGGRITGGSGLTTHAFGTTVDINPDQNPYGRELITDMPVCMVAQILGIETKSGQRAFRHGVDWDGDGDISDTRIFDAMHFELQLTPAELGQEMVVPLHPMTDQPIDLDAPPTLSLGDKGDHVRKLQKLLNDVAGSGIPEDGGFGVLTRKAVMRFQESRGLLADGVVGPLTWGALGG